MTHNTHILTLQRRRNEAVAFEKRLDPARRKRLGQFFSGVPLSRLLAAVSTPENLQTVIDPMAGHGDLLDAVLERSWLRQKRLAFVEAVEIDPQVASSCEARLEPWIEARIAPRGIVHVGSVFDDRIFKQLSGDGYELAITNPPYVRYQLLSGGEGFESQAWSEIRTALLSFLDLRGDSQARALWRVLVESYSGLADLSVPCWLLAAMLVRPGGNLALVAPATWRTRDYADILQYMLARFFELKVIVADRQPGWFSTALVRTHLVVARRLSEAEALVSLQDRPLSDRSFVWAELAPEAADRGSLVGSAFTGDDPEAMFAQWLGDRPESSAVPGIRIEQRSLQTEADTILQRIGRFEWGRKLEPSRSNLPLFAVAEQTNNGLVPYEIRELLPCPEYRVVELDKAGIDVGQGLRTGCNGFFYVELLDELAGDQALIKLSDFFSTQLVVPTAALKPVLQKQTETPLLLAGRIPPGRVLDLRRFVLSEDLECIRKVKNGDALAKDFALMPKSLAQFVRQAAITEYKGKIIPELSAVATNVRRSSSQNDAVPRFWYQLPDFAPRHLPDAFVARINNGLPQTIANAVPPIVIDANFSTLWSGDPKWTAPAIVALLNSAWVQVCMELIGTPMGGGALKLEASHLRRIPVPKLGKDETLRLEALGKQYVAGGHYEPRVLQQVDALIVNAALFTSAKEYNTNISLERLRGLALTLQQARQRR